jgi:hypothetical protein
MFGRKMAREQPKRDRIRFNATGFVLAQDPRTEIYPSVEYIVNS